MGCGFNKVKEKRTALRFRTCGFYDERFEDCIEEGISKRSLKLMNGFWKTIPFLTLNKKIGLLEKEIKDDGVFQEVYKSVLDIIDDIIKSAEERPAVFIRNNIKYYWLEKYVNGVVVLNELGLQINQGEIIIKNGIAKMMLIKKRTELDKILDY